MIYILLHFSQSCVFDLPSELDSVVEDHWADGQFDTLTKATSLPELIEDGYGGGRGDKIHDIYPNKDISGQFHSLGLD